MATVLKKTDVAIVGFGWVGAIMAKELTEAGSTSSRWSAARCATPGRTAPIRR